MLFAAVMAAQPSAEEERLATAFKQFSELVNSGELAKAEEILRAALPSPISEPRKKPGDIKISLYGLSWAMLITSYSAKDDFASAERVIAERVNVSEKIFGPYHMGVAAFLNLRASTYLKEGKYDEAIPVYQRSLRIHEAAGAADAIIAGPIYNGLGEALLAKGKAEEAVQLLKPVVAQSRVGLNERLFNFYAVALREAGQSSEADRVEQEVEAKSHLRPGINKQERDFLQARLLVVRGRAKNADAIYQQWIHHWEEWGRAVGSDPKEREWDRILMGPLSEYAHYLASERRDEDAIRVRARLTSIMKKYDVKFPE